MNKPLAAAALITALVALPAASQQMFNSCVENETADCAVTLPSSFNTANAKLPDPFTKIDGTRIAAKEDWACRRQEILRLAERTIYGVKPPKPSSVTGTVSRTSISVNVSEGGKTGTFSASVTMPAAGTAPYPAVISYGNSGATSASVTKEGVAYINFTPTSVGGENTPTGRARSGVFFNIYGTDHEAGTLIAWAWGVSRIIDVIESDPNNLFDPTAIGVTGCSRFGKGPFVAAAFDQRIALAMPMEGGTGGSNLMRLAHSTSGAQSPSSAYGEQPWLGNVFNSFTSNPNNLPIDMHSVVGLIAPRGLLFLDKTPESSDWLATQASYAAAQAGAEVYKALGAGGNLHYISNTGSSGHCSWNAGAYDAAVSDFIQKYLTRTKAVSGNTPTFNAANSSRNPNMANLIDWTTPTLSGGLTIGGGNCDDRPPPPPPEPDIRLVVAAGEGGSVDLDDTTYHFNTDTVFVTAVPDDGYVFAAWTGDVPGSANAADNPIKLPMTRARTLTATFAKTPTGVITALSCANGRRGLRVTALSKSAMRVDFDSHGSGGTASVRLYSLKGGAVSSARIKTVAGQRYSHTFSTAKLPTGFYMIEVRHNAIIERARVIVSR